MTWYFVILVLSLIGILIGYLNSKQENDTASSALARGVGCGYVGLQIFLALAGLAFLLVMARWLTS